VDGDQQRLRTTSQRLASAGYQVQEATDGSNALRLIRANRPDLLLLDDALTDVDVVPLCERLRADASLAGMGILMLCSSGPASGSRASGWAAPADAYMAHPFSGEELMARVRGVLRLQQDNAALRESEERYRALFQHSLDLVNVVDADGRLLYASPSHEWILGYAPEELVGSNMLQLVHPEDLEQVQQALGGIQEKPQAAATVTFRVRHRDGSWRWIESTGRNLLDNPAVAGIVGNCRDVTEQMEAAEKLRESEVRFKAQYKGLPIPVYNWQRMGDDFVLVDYNHAAEETTGGKVSDLLGSKASTLYQDAPDIVEEMRRCYETQRSFRREMLYRFRSIDATRYMSVSYGFVPPDIVLVHTVDVTDHVETEETLRKLYQEVETRVRARTSDLDRANRALRAEIAQHEQAQKEIERSQEREGVINALLRISIEDMPLTEQLDRALSTILSIPWLPVLPQGAIFLRGDQPGALELRIHQGLSPAFEAACTRVDFGRCLCGRAAIDAEIVFSDGVDERHEKVYEGMEPHGHYCIPIVSSKKAIGILVIYLDPGHQQDPEEQEFLRTVAHTLAGIVERKWAEEAVRDSERRYRLLAENATDLISRHSPAGTYRYASPVCRSLLGFEPQELIGRDAYEFFHPDDLERIHLSHRTILEQPIPYTIRYRLRRKDGAYVWVETSSKTVPNAETGQVEEIIAITRDITERRKAEEALRESEERLRDLNAQLAEHSQTLEDRVVARTREIEQRRQVAESLRGMLAVLNSDLALDEILDHIVAQASQLLGSDASAIYRLEAEEGIFSARTVRGPSPDAIANLDFPPDLRQALRRGEPMAVPDLTAMSASPVQPSAFECLGDCCRALLAVPLIVKGEVYGGLVLYYSQPRKVSEEELGLAVAFADQAALAIENARLHAQLREAAVMEERARLARELHDSVTQALFSMTLLAEAGLRLAGAGNLERVETYLARLGETSQQALKEMRLLVYELRPLALERVGLIGALQQRLDAVEVRAGVQARLLVEGTCQVTTAMEEELYRIAEQALNNALKHASATSVLVRIQGDGRRLSIEVVDDGAGFDLDTVTDKGGQGLRSMQERAERIDGVLQIHTAPDQGTTVRVEVEVPDSRETGAGS
jgi:PAS domain S-box-containing protein